MLMTLHRLHWNVDSVIQLSLTAKFIQNTEFTQEMSAIYMMSTIRIVPIKLSFYTTHGGIPQRTKEIMLMTENKDE